MSSPDPLDQLKKLAELRDQGIVSSQEFETKKAQLLASVGQVSAAPPEPGEPASASPTAELTMPAPASPKAAIPPLEQLSDAELVGRVRAADVAQAEQQWRSLDESLREAAGSRAQLRRRRVFARLRLRYNLFVQASRRLFDRGLMGRPGARAILLAAIVGLVLIVTIFCTLNPVVLLAAALFGGMLAYLWVRDLLFYPPDAAVAAAETALRRAIDDFAEPMKRSNEELEKLAAQCREARKTWERFRTAFASRKRRLLATDYRALRGISFSNFLAEAFEDLGFAVQATKVPGDQPVDLILTRGEVRIAVQAETPELTVGIGPIRQVQTDKIACRCDRCCVITNRTFTTGAKQLAADLGCQLIDGRQIPDLLRGKIAV